jgi:hypothetical protein
MKTLNIINHKLFTPTVIICLLLGIFLGIIFTKLFLVKKEGYKMNGSLNRDTSFVPIEQMPTLTQEEKNQANANAEANFNAMVANGTWVDGEM